MLKRTLESPDLSLHNPKRLHTSSTHRLHKSQVSIGSLYDELILHVFSHLESTELCVAQAINREWARLAVDNELWKRLYTSVFGRTRLRGGRGFGGLSGKEINSRPIKNLPIRHGMPAHRTDAEERWKDWKWMFRISSNWRKGRCLLQEIPSADGFQESHLLLTRAWIITASARDTPLPTILLNNVATSTKDIWTCPAPQREISPCHFTTIAIDQSPPSSPAHLRLCAFLSSGVSYIFSHPRTSQSPVLRSPPRPSSSSPVIHAAYHHPLLITLSQEFHISLYHISGAGIRRTQVLTSFACFHPTSLVLSAPSPNVYKLILAYTVPVYPAHWTVGATELLISGNGETPRHLAKTFDETELRTVEPMTVFDTRTVKALDVPQGWIDAEKLETMREQWGRKVLRAASVQTDGKWVVLAPATVDRGRPLAGLSSSSSSSSEESSDAETDMRTVTSLQLYRLSFPAHTPSVSAPQAKLTFVRTLHGQVGAVGSLALADGRCVSRGVRGGIWVWDLERGMGVNVDSGPAHIGLLPNSEVGTTVAFDERRIVTTEGGKVLVRNFDI